MLRARIFAVFGALLTAYCPNIQAQLCASGEVRTAEAYQYGRFETRMQSVDGDGVVSSFFLYNIDVNCSWPDVNNEIDIEMTGNRDNSVQFTTHYPGPVGHTHIDIVPFNPHAGMHDYAFEWEPGIVRWFVDGNLVYIQNQPFVQGLIHPMRIMMNLWSVDNPNWTGIFDPSIMPANARYDYVRYYAYTPGSGHAGTSNNFTLEWTDNFDGPLDLARWEVSDHDTFGDNHCTFVSNNVQTSNGELHLNMTDPLAPTNSMVTFSVDASDQNLGPGDTVFLNGGFNNWCGNCMPMFDPDNDGIWERSISLPAGEHEYLFTVNGWSGEIGRPDQGSACDYLPCDEYANYGVEVPFGSGPIVDKTWCWDSCGECPDADGDGVPDTQDNCPAMANGGQENNDGDAQGDVCDPDDDNDNVSDVDEMNYDGNPAYNPATDTDPFNADTDGDSYNDDVDPVPLNYNHADGDIAPPGAPDGNLDAADRLLYARILEGDIAPTAHALAHGDLHPPGAPDGLIELSDYLLLLKLIEADD